MKRHKRPKIEFNIAVLIRARLEKGWSRETLAGKIDRSANMVYKIENGDRASERTIFRMSKVLGVPMKEIIKVDDTNAA